MTEMEKLHAFSGSVMRRRLAGWTFIVVVHAVLVYLMIHQQPFRQPDNVPAQRITMVTIKVAPPQAEVMPPPAVNLLAPAPIRLPVQTVRHANPSRTAPPIPVQVIMPKETVPTDMPGHPDVVSGAASAFDLEAARSSARATAKDDAGTGRNGRAVTVLEATKDEKLGGAIDKARNGDCQTQYAGLGIIAIIPLVKDTVTGRGCKWK